MRCTGAVVSRVANCSNERAGTASICLEQLLEAAGQPHKHTTGCQPVNNLQQAADLTSCHRAGSTLLYSARRDIDAWLMSLKSPPGWPESPLHCAPVRPHCPCAAQTQQVAAALPAHMRGGPPQALQLLQA